MRVFWPPVSSIFLQYYELVGFHYQAADIPGLGYVYSPSTFSIPPMSNMHANEDTGQTKDRQWAHLWPPVWSGRLSQ